MSRNIESSHQVENHNSNIVVGEIVVATLGSFAIASIFAVSIYAIFKRSAKNRVQRLNRHKQLKVPCENCKFFDPNLYLKCAVNPSIVMTKEADDCSDYLYEEIHKDKASNQLDCYPD
ncbi:MAG: hypothetical protein ACFB02_10735 [Mastigocoleus sp.]